MLLAGRDLIGSAQTGTGKTAAFVLPALQRLAASGTRAGAGRNGVATPRILVLAPTRELAQQVAEQAVRYGRSLRVNTVCIYGGAPYPIQNRELARGADIIVATPGRLIDHLERGRIDLSALEMLVLDEADRMLDMGFVDDVERIAAAGAEDAADGAVLGDLRRRHRAAVRAPDARRGAHRSPGREGGAGGDRAARALRRRPLAQAPASSTTCSPTSR